MLLPPRLERQC